MKSTSIDSHRRESFCSVFEERPSVFALQQKMSLRLSHFLYRAFLKIVTFLKPIISCFLMLFEIDEFLLPFLIALFGGQFVDIFC
jgi:hypothetical protein